MNLQNYPWGDNVIRPKNIRFDYTVKCLPLGICNTCRNPTNGYCKECDTICERCAIGYTNAFHQIVKEKFGIIVQTTKEADRQT